MPVTVSAPEVWPMASTAGRARRTASGVPGDGGVDERDDRPGGVAVGGGVEQGGRDGGGGAEPGAHGIRERLAGAERVGDEQRAGERVVPEGVSPAPRPTSPATRRPRSGAQVAASETVRHPTRQRRGCRREPPALVPVARLVAAPARVGAQVVCPGDRLGTRLRGGRRGGRGRGARCARPRRRSPAARCDPHRRSTSLARRRRPTTPPPPARRAERRSAARTASEVTTGSTDPRTDEVQRVSVRGEDRRGDRLPLHHRGHERRDGRGQRGSRNRPVRGHGATLSRGLQ